MLKGDQQMRHNVFYPIRDYWACFAPGSSARRPFLIYFFRNNTKLEMNLLLRDMIKDTPLVKESRKR